MTRSLTISGVGTASDYSAVIAALEYANNNMKDIFSFLASTADRTVTVVAYDTDGLTSAPASASISIDRTCGSVSRVVSLSSDLLSLEKCVKVVGDLNIQCGGDVCGVTSLSGLQDLTVNDFDFVFLFYCVCSVGSDRIFAHHGYPID